MSRVIGEHQHYLADKVRVDAFSRAIAELVPAGAVVLDLGSGTGIMGMLACRAGASRVYCIEQDSIIQVARDIARENGYSNQMRFVKGMSTRVTLPEAVDVVVTDQIGRFGYDAGALEYLSDARRRFLKPGGVLIPASITVLVAAVEKPETWDQVAFWEQEIAGFTFDPVRNAAANSQLGASFERAELLSDEAMVASLDTTTRGTEPFAVDVTLEILRDGTLHGIGGWFSAQLSPTVRVSNSPLAAERTDRPHAFLPIQEPVPVRAGEAVRVALRIYPNETLIAWTTEVLAPRTGDAPRPVRARFKQSTLQGIMLSEEELVRTKLTSVPRLSAAGEARRTVLNLCDGERKLAEIEAEVYRKHPGLFASMADAAHFASEVVTRYAE